jgi:hypothetical protein
LLLLVRSAQTGGACRVNSGPAEKPVSEVFAPEDQDLLR